MADVSAIAFDATVRHAVLLEQLKAGQARALLPFLREIDEAIRLRLSKGELTKFSRTRLEKQLAAVEENIDGIMKNYMALNRKELRALAGAEARFEAATLQESVQNKAFDAEVPSPRQAWAAATANPLSVRGVAGGQLLEGFIKNWSESQKNALVGRIRRGVFEGETNGDILRGIRGTVGGRFREGILGQTYRQSQAMIRTSVQHVSHQARLATFQANDDLVTGYQWVSTLDNRTSEICQALSGEVFKLEDGGPVPPAHINCRSTIVAELDEDFDFLKEGRTQSSQYGPVDANETYYSWLKQQPAEFQDQVIGPVKGKLFREGGLTAKDFQKLVRSENYTPISLAQMEKLNPMAFKNAGIRITESGRAVVSAGSQAVIQAAQAQKLGGSAAAAQPKKVGLTGSSKVRVNDDMNKWRRADTFDSPRLATIEGAVDDPKAIGSRKGTGAFYRSNEELVQMASFKASDQVGRSVMRHEWGHYLDDTLGRLGRDKNNTFSRKLLVELAGETGSHQGYISAWTKPAAALLGDGKLLEGLGKRIYKKVFPSSRARLFNNQRVNDAWGYRRGQLLTEKVGGAQAAKAAAAALEESDHLIARLWRRMRANPDFSVSMVDNRLFYEAMKADDLSVLFMDRGQYLRAALRSVDSADGQAVYGAITDTIAAATKGNLGDHYMGWGHGKGYWKRGIHAQATEAFAELTQLEKVRRADALVDDLVRALMPEFSAWYDELIDRLNGLLSGGGT